MNDVVGKLTKQQDAVAVYKSAARLPDMVRHVGTETFTRGRGCTSYMRFVGLEWSYGSSEVDRFPLLQGMARRMILGAMR